MDDFERYRRYRQSKDNVWEDVIPDGRVLIAGPLYLALDNIWFMVEENRSHPGAWLELPTFPIGDYVGEGEGLPDEGQGDIFSERWGVVRLIDDGGNRRRGYRLVERKGDVKKMGTEGGREAGCMD